MDEGSVKIHEKFRLFLQALLISAVMLAPAVGQIHKTIHGQTSHPVAKQDLFSDHTQGSLVCLTLDHLGSGEGLQWVCPTVAIVQTQPSYFCVACKPFFSDLLLAFSPRAPPTVF